MSKPSIKIENVGKRYLLGKGGDGSLRDSIMSRVKGIVSPRATTEEFWALKGVSTTINQGDRVGIVGRNGAGKSTILKILSRITAPTEGRIELNGRLASLLEVGTGFHPELTGRENIYLNGTILGMKRKEIKLVFDEIVQFSGIEKFIDTPVKRYSSGMYVRLAFAVAAHLRSDILVIDEVLAVGDVEFQKKCLGKMEEVATQGRTILFVSHNMGAVQNLCNRCVMLQKGELKMDGTTDEILSAYLSSMDGSTGLPYVDLINYKERSGNQTVRFTRIEMLNAKGEPCNQFSMGEAVKFKLFLEAKAEVRDYKISLIFHNSMGAPIGNFINSDSGFQTDPFTGEKCIEVTFEDLRFYPDKYFVGVWIGGKESVDDFDYVQNCISFEIINGGVLTQRRLPTSAGFLFLTPEWNNA